MKNMTKKQIPLNQLIESLPKPKRRHKFLRKLGLIPMIDFKNFQRIMNYTFENIKFFMGEQKKLNDDFKKFMDDFKKPCEDNFEKGMIR